MITPLKKEKEKRKLWITSGESKGVNRLMAAVNLSFSFRTHQSWTHQREGREHLWNLNLGSARQSLLSCDQLFFFLSLLIYCWSLMDIHLFLIQILASDPYYFSYSRSLPSIIYFTRIGWATGITFFSLLTSPVPLSFPLTFLCMVELGLRMEIISFFQASKPFYLSCYLGDAWD